VARGRGGNPPDLAAPVGAWSWPPCSAPAIWPSESWPDKADAVLAGAGVANLATWLGVHLARRRGASVELTAELGLWGYEPTPADPFVFNHRSFPTATMLSDSEHVLGVMAGSPGTTLLACLGAAQIDRFGNHQTRRSFPGAPSWSDRVAAMTWPPEPTRSW